MNLESGSEVRTAFDWQRGIGKLEIATAALLAAWRLLSWYFPGSLMALIAGIAFTSLFGWAAVRWIGRFMRHALWRLRNRLLLSYVFIAVVPVLLLAVLGLAAIWVLSGQMAVYLVAQRFQQDISSLHQIGTVLTHSEDGDSPVSPARMTAYLNTQFPGVQVLVTNGTNEIAHLPPEARLTHPPGDEQRQFMGIVLKDGMLYAGVHISESGRRATILAPLTKPYLQSLVPNLGEITLIDFFTSDGEKPRLTMRLHASKSKANRDGDALPNRAVAPPVNFFDFEGSWGSPQPVILWDQPGRESAGLLGVITRVSQVFRVIFSQKADWDQSFYMSAFYSVAVLFLFVEMVALISGISISRTMTRALHYLYESTERVQAGDFTYRIPVKGKDQLADLGRRYNMMIENLDRLLKVAKEKERLQADLDIAKEVQEQLYPRTVPEVAGLQLTAGLAPARSVSGDYYDYQKFNETCVAIAMGDVAGKGISAALLMANVQSTLRAQLRSLQEQGRSLSPSSVVSQLNKHLQANTTPEKYATFFFSVYDQTTSELISTNAGHLPPILLRNGKPQYLDINGMVVGILPNAPYNESRTKLEIGDILVLYTDGITEPENEYGEMFGEERLIETVIRNSHKPNEEILRDVFEAVREWTFAPESADDITMMLIRRV